MLSLNLLGRILRELSKSIPYWTLYFFPRNKRIWVFGSMYGKGYGDNSKYLFNYVHQHHKNIYPIWITQKKDIVELLQKEGKEAYHYHSIKGIWYTLRAKCVISTHEPSYDVPGYLIGGTKIVQLNHGTPLKRIVFDDKMNQNFEMKSRFPYILIRFIFALLPFRNFGKFDLYCSASEFINDNIATAFRQQKEKIKVTGYPRNDILLSHQPDEKIHPFVSALRSVYDDCKIVLYAPTYNYDEKKNIKPDIKGLSESFQLLNSFCKENKIVFIFRAHPFVSRRLALINNVQIRNHVCANSYTLKLLGDESNIVWGNGDDLEDFYPVLKYTDLLITDYSSIYFDFLLLNRPIIFYVTSDDLIRAQRGFYHDFEEVSPGPKVGTFVDLINQMKILLKNPHIDENERVKIQKLFNTFIDAGSCERVYREILKL